MYESVAACEALYRCTNAYICACIGHANRQITCKAAAQCRTGTDKAIYLALCGGDVGLNVTCGFVIEVIGELLDIGGAELAVFGLQRQGKHRAQCHASMRLICWRGHKANQVNRKVGVLFFGGRWAGMDGEHVNQCARNRKDVPSHRPACALQTR